MDTKAVRGLFQLPDAKDTPGLHRDSYHTSPPSVVMWRTQRAAVVNQTGRTETSHPNAGSAHWQAFLEAFRAVGWILTGRYSTPHSLNDIPSWFSQKAG